MEEVELECVWRGVSRNSLFGLQATLADSFLADLEDLSDDENRDEVSASGCFGSLCRLSVAV